MKRDPCESGATAAARVGRPRASARRPTRPPAEEILHAASRLFATKGFGGTSTREIAAAAGLRQPSLFHYFATKDAILEALLERSLAAPLAFIERLAREPLPAAVQIYRAIRFDVHYLCSYPFDLDALLAPEARQPRFRHVWRKRERLLATFVSLVKRGVASGELVAADAEIAANAIFGMDEWTLSWYRRRRWPAERIADGVATLALRALLADPARVDEIRRLADAERAPEEAAAAVPPRRR